ncbi:MAG: hypothetical protein OHK0040_06510 [bacterium]
MAFTYFFSNLKIKWKILALVLPLVIIPIMLAASVVGYVANRQAYLGITETSMADLEHMAQFSIGLLTYHNETYGSPTKNPEKLALLKRIIKEKKVGETGYIYCIDTKGTLTIHPAREGDNIIDATDYNGSYFIKEMIKYKNGWIRYPWKNPGEKSARMKIVRYLYFEPWQWIVAVGSYENEFYKEANKIKERILLNTIIIIILTTIISVFLVFKLSLKLTNPIKNMIDVIRKIKRGKMDERIYIISNDEIGELADNFNRMFDLIKKQKEIEQSINQQSKMASLGVLASEVAHEINNPIGIILGYASFLENKVSSDEKMKNIITEIKKESQRCKKIVENFLNYARIPNPVLKEININSLLEEIISFAVNHPDLGNIEIEKHFDNSLPLIMADEDQIKQVAINLIFNAAYAIEGTGKITVKTEKGLEGFVNIIFKDTGKGIPEEHLEKIFEPFFTTKPKGTGLGLAIARQIVKQHLGNISIQSTVGKGTMVIVSLPIERNW